MRAVIAKAQKILIIRVERRKSIKSIQIPNLKMKNIRKRVKKRNQIPKVIMPKKSREMKMKKLKRNEKENKR